MSGSSNPPVYMPAPINVCKPGALAEMDNFLKPVGPSEAGEGVPYAPVDWPNPGDNWGWRVGRRVSSSGYYTDRFLYLPKSIQKAGSPKQFASKLSLERYMRSEFPGADLDAFFASFSWKVPSPLFYSTEVKAATFSPRVSPVPETGKFEDEKEELTTPVKRKTKHTAASSSVKRQTRQSRRQVINDAGDTIDSHSPNKEEAAGESPSKNMKNTTNFDDVKLDDDLFAGKNSPAEHVSMEFDSYLDSLVNSLAQPLSEPPINDNVTVNSPPLDNEWAGGQVPEEDKAKVTSLRKEYSELKEKVTLLQIEVDSSLLSVKGIDDQIVQLQSRRAELMRIIETKKMAKFKLTIDQKKVADTIQKTVHEIQLKTQKSQNGG